MLIGARDIAQAVAALASGAVVAYPTETVYGLGADAADQDALEALIELKGRGAGKGLSLLVTGLAMAAELLSEPPPAAARELAECFWPGPLTLVLPAVESLPSALRGPGGGVGLRCSPDPLASALLSAFGRPLSSTSANPSGAPEARTVEQAREYFGAGVAVYLDGGARNGRASSSVVEFLGGCAYLRRAGALARADIENFVQLENAEN